MDIEVQGHSGLLQLKIWKIWPVSAIKNRNWLHLLYNWFAGTADIYFYI